MTKVSTNSNTQAKSLPPLADAVPPITTCSIVTRLSGCTRPARRSRPNQGWVGCDTVRCGGLSFRGRGRGRFLVVVVLVVETVDSVVFRVGCGRALGVVARARVLGLVLCPRCLWGLSAKPRPWLRRVAPGHWPAHGGRPWHGSLADGGPAPASGSSPVSSPVSSPLLVAALVAATLRAGVLGCLLGVLVLDLGGLDTHGPRLPSLPSGTSTCTARSTSWATVWARSGSASAIASPVDPTRKPATAAAAIPAHTNPRRLLSPWPVRRRSVACSRRVLASIGCRPMFRNRRSMSSWSTLQQTTAGRKGHAPHFLGRSTNQSRSRSRPAPAASSPLPTVSR